MSGTNINVLDDERLYYGSNISQAPLKANKGSFFIITDNGLESGNIIDTYVFTKVWEKIGCKSSEKLGYLFQDNFNREELGFDYSVNGIVANIVNNKLILSGIGNLTNFQKNIFNNKNSNVEDFTAKIIFKPISEKNTSNYGLAFLVQSIGTYFKYSFYMLLDYSSNPDGGKLKIYSSNNNGSSFNILHVSNRALIFSKNDKIEYKIIRNKNIYLFSVNNLSTGDTLTYQLICSISPNFASNKMVNNCFKIGISKQDSINSSYEIELFELERNIYKNRDFLFLGDSITFGYEAEEIKNRFADLVFDNFKIYDRHQVYAQPGNSTLDFLNLNNEISEFNSKYCIVMIGMNDANKQVNLLTFQTNYTTLINNLISLGITPILCTITYYSPANETIKEYNNWIKSNFSNYKIIDTYAVSLDLFTSLHPVKEGHSVLAMKIFDEIKDLI